MGSGSNKRWYDIIRSRILGSRDVSEVDADSGTGESEGAETPVRDNSEVRTIPDPPDPKPEVPENTNVTYDPPAAPEQPAPQVLGAISDGTSMMYVQTAFWVAAYVRERARRGDFTEDQLIEQFGVNVRRCINPEWKGQG